MAQGAKKILSIDKEQELLQSFVRIGVQTEEEIEEEPKKSNGRSSSVSKSVPTKERKKNVKIVEPEKIEKALLKSKKYKVNADTKKRKPRDSFNDVYTDKDRAAAVSAGSYDIKQSLKLKQKQERTEAMMVPDEADVSSLIALGLKEMKNANIDNAILCLSKALELNNHDLNALVSRSKCFLLLGQAAKALQDAETALVADKTSIRAIYQKAESLYYLGQFEQSLMFFHRGLRARPELASFRLGVQKTQEAIENTIGVSKAKNALPPKKHEKPNKIEEKHSIKPQVNSKSISKPKVLKVDMERRNARKLLGELCVDKEYLENLLKHPDLKRADSNTENISTYAKEAVEFLNKRQEFWRQQRPCTALPNGKNLSADFLTHW